MAISVTDLGGGTDKSNAATVVTTLATSVPAGSFIFAGACERGNNATRGTFADSAGNTYTTITSILLNNSQTQGYVIAYYIKTCLALNSGQTITFTKVNATNAAATSILYATGIDTDNPLDTAVTATATGSSSTPSVTSGTPTIAGELFIGLVGNGAGATWTVDSANGWASPPSLHQTGTGAADASCGGGNQVNVGTGTKTHAPTFSNSGVWGDMVFGFKPAAALSWLQALSVPIRNAALATALIAPAFFYNPLLVGGENITVDKWFAHLSVPAKTLPNLGAPRQQAFFAEPFSLTQPEAVLYSKFAYQWSEPARTAPRLATGLHQFLAFQPAPSPFVASGWFNWLSEPARTAPRLTTGLQQFLAFHPAPSPFVATGWFNWLSAPPRTIPRLPAGLQQFLVFQPPTSPLAAFGWFNVLSEPVRTALRLPAGLHQFLAFQPMPSPFVATGWFNWLSEPTRTAPRLRPALQQFLAYGNQKPLVSFGWEQRLSEPIRFKPALRASLQQFDALQVPVVPAPSGFIQGWFMWLSEPSRTLPGLRAWLQQTTALPPRILPGGGITGTMATTELGDIFSAGGTFWNQATSAQVGIIEIVPRSAFVGVIETQQVSANVGQVSNIASQQSGLTVSSSYAANVSIRTV